MTENNNNLKEEQLKEVAGGTGASGVKLYDEIALMADELLNLTSWLFDPVHQEEYPDLKILHDNIQKLIEYKSYHVRYKCVKEALKIVDKLREFPFSIHHDFIRVKECLIEIQKLLI